MAEGGRGGGSDGGSGARARRLSRHLARVGRTVGRLRRNGLRRRGADWFPEPEPREPDVFPDQFVATADDGRARAFADRLLARLQQADIPVFEGGSEHDDGILLNLRAKDFARLLDLLAELTEGVPAWALQPTGRVGMLDGLDRAEPEPFDLGLVRHAQEALRLEAFGPIVGFTFWDRAPSYAAERPVVPDRPNRLVSRGSSFGTVRGNIERIRETAERHPRTTLNTLPVDVVYTWVDDGDADWAREKDAWAARAGRPANAQARALHSERFRNRDELRYSLRSLEMFAPWVRRVFIVTADQTPAWLNLDHPKVELVSHRDIYRDADALPTFNSSGIETQLHHIEGLSEHFVYFNDDMFLGRMVGRDDFFYGNGIARFYCSERMTIPEATGEDVEEYMQADFNAIRMFREAFDIDAAFIMEHVPYASRRSVLDELEARFPEAFRRCAMGRFRSGDDIRPIAFMHPHYAYATGRAVPSETRYRYLALWKRTVVGQMRNVLKRRRHKFFCLNDVGIPPEREAIVDEAVDRFLRASFPLPSAFEREGA